MSYILDVVASGMVQVNLLLLFIPQCLNYNIKPAGLKADLLFL